MGALNFPITLEEESDYEMELQVVQDCGTLDITDYGAKFQIRNAADTTLVALITASVSDGRITISDAANGKFYLNLPASSINALKGVIEERAVYNLNVWPSLASPDVNPKRVLEGRVRYSPSAIDVF